MGERWEFPGGKIEEGEDFAQAINREMLEEFGCRVKIFEQLAKADFVHNGKNCTVNAFRVEFENDGTEKPFVLTEHTQTHWVSPDQILSRQFVDSDLSLFPQIKQSLGF